MSSKHHVEPPSGPPAKAPREDTPSDIVDVPMEDIDPLSGAVPPSGPPAKVRREDTPSPLSTPSDIVDEDMDPLSGAVPISRDFSPMTLSYLAKTMKRQREQKLNDAASAEGDAFRKVLSTVWHVINIFDETPPKSFVKDVNQVLSNATLSSEFVKLLRVAFNGDDESLWPPVVTHDVFHTMPGIVSALSDPDSVKSQTLPDYQEEAVEKSWEATFVGTHAMEALEAHMIELMKNSGKYAPLCSVVQSSGMGKSRLIDEFSKRHFLIPLNLRTKSAGGFPPPDENIRDLLTVHGANAGEDKTRMLRFLFVLFSETANVLEIELKVTGNRPACIAQFREYMTYGQQFREVGSKRREFYKRVVSAVEDRQNASVTYKDVRGALKGLRAKLGSPVDNREYIPAISIAFDEAQSLTLPKLGSDRTNFIELRWAIQKLSRSSFMSIFLSTNSKISQFAIPKGADPSYRWRSDRLRSYRPFSDLGFDHLMRNGKMFVKYKTIEDVTSTECVTRMGRPLWGTLHDYSDPEHQPDILIFAKEKLLCHFGNPTYLPRHQCAVLSQRLALEIDSSAYVLGEYTKDEDIADKIQEQIANHMRVCVAIPQNLLAVYGVAASEPILSEAASFIMREDKFILVEALKGIWQSYAIDAGERGELLVAAFFTRARDIHVNQTQYRLDPTQLCHTFSVMDLLSGLFHEKVLNIILESTPSLCSPDFESSQKFKDVFSNTKMHYNHMIKPIKQSILGRPYLLAIMTRGAAAYGANGQRGYDMVFPFLYDTNILDVTRVGFIIVQVKNHVKGKKVDSGLFEGMDPFRCGLLSDKEALTVPIIRIVFSLGGKPGKGQGLQRMPDSEDESSRFTSYDFWCSGMGPKLLRPVDEGNKQGDWEALLRQPRPSDLKFSDSMAADVRRSQYPAGGDDKAFYEAWLSDDLTELVLGT